METVMTQQRASTGGDKSKSAGAGHLGVGGGVCGGRVLLLLPARQRLQHLLLVGVLLAAATNTMQDFSKCNR